MTQNLQISQYQIIEQIGQGGMAKVYKALDTRLEREVAIKIIRRGAFPPDDLDRILKRFEREAKSLARLSHPHIVKVLDSGEHDGSPYLVLEYLPGGTLKERLNGAMPWDQAVALLLPIAHALHYAHQQGFIHRDIKPANILLAADGQPMLSDFGIAKLLSHEETQTLTGTGMGVGTPEYMAPEQGMGAEADARSDIYALGVVLYEMVTGRKPFQGETPMAVVVKHINESVERPSRLVRGLPRPVEQILLKALDKKPEQRYRDMGKFAAAMEKMLMEKKPVGESAEPTEADATYDQIVLPKPRRRRKPKKPKSPIPIWGLIVGGVILAGLAVWVVLQVASNNQIAVSQVTETDVEIVEMQASPTAPSTATSTATSVPTDTLQPTETSTTMPIQTELPTATEISVSFSPITVENIASLSELTRQSFAGVRHIQWSNDGEIIAILSSEEFQVWDSTFVSQVFSLKGEQYNRSDEFALHPTNHIVAIRVGTDHTDDYLEIWDIDSGDVLPAPSSGQTGCCFYSEWSPDGDTLALAMINTNIGFYELATGEMSYLPTDHGNRFREVAWSPDGTRLATASQDTTVKIWDFSSRQIIRTIQGHDILTTISWSPDGKYIAYGNWEESGANFSDEDITIILEIDKLRKAAELNVAYHVYWSPDDSMVAGESESGVRIWDTATWDALATLENQHAPVAWSSDGTQLATYDGEEIVFWGVQSTTQTELSLESQPWGVGSTQTSPKDGMVQVFIPAGEFEMGKNAEERDGLEINDAILHTVYLDAFWMDQTEVTNTQYALCVQSGVCNLPAGTNTYSDSDYADHPVVNVYWDDAKTYCAWAGRYLPTEAEWEKAARGGLAGQSYPWGNEVPVCSSVAENGAQIDECGERTVPVKSFSPNGYGVYDAVGNVFEWVNDWYDFQYYQDSPSTNPQGPASSNTIDIMTDGNYRIVRGGSWFQSYSTIPDRIATLEDSIRYDFGFRCATDGEVPSSSALLTETPSVSGTELVETDLGIEISGSYTCSLGYFPDQPELLYLIPFRCVDTQGSPIVAENENWVGFPGFKEIGQWAKILNNGTVMKFIEDGLIDFDTMPEFLQTLVLDENGGLAEEYQLADVYWDNESGERQQFIFTPDGDGSGTRKHIAALEDGRWLILEVDHSK